MEVDFHSTLGATYIGVTITACLYGISTLHGYTYWNRQRQDRTVARILVVVLWLADTVKLVCATHIGYRLLITEYENDPERLFYSTWSINMEFLLTTLIIFGAQVFTAYHACRSAKQTHVFWATPHVIRVMVIIIVSFAFLQLSFGITLSSLAWVYWDIREMDKYRWIASAWLGSAAFGSIIITYVLSAFLLSANIRAQSAMYLVGGFIGGITHTGLLTSILTITNLLTFSFMGQYVRIAVNFPLGTLNLITLLAILNIRPQETLDTMTLEDSCITGQKEVLHMERSQTSLAGSLRMKLSSNMPSKLQKTNPSIKVFVKKEIHVISISQIDANCSNSMMKHQDDPDGGESIETRGDLAKLETSLI